jgi:hypothetical protein
MDRVPERASGHHQNRTFDRFPYSELAILTNSPDDIACKRSVKSACRRSRIEAMMGGWQRQQTECPLTA